VSFAVAAACGGQARRSAATATAATAASSNTRSSVATRTAIEKVGVELPAGAGRDVLIRACIGCHDLGGLPLFKGYFSRDDWHSLLVTMVEHGAVVEAAEVEGLADYLTLHFGPN
jgi:cytochrome c5